jgi:hypothetical protein
MAIAPATVVDTFSRNTGSTIGTSDSGHAWTTNATVNVGTQHVAITATANMSRRYLRVEAGQDVLVSSSLSRFSFDGTAAWPLTDFGPTLVHNASNVCYALAIQANYSEIAIQVHTGGTRYEMHRVSYSLEKNIQYWVRFEVLASSLRAKIWKVGATEPTAWTITTSELWLYSGPPSTGDAGWYVQGTRDAYTVRLSTFYYYSDHGYEGTNRVNDVFNHVVTDGWGVAESGHMWRGAFSDDPQNTGKSATGVVINNQGYTDASDGVLEVADLTPRYGVLGMAKASDAETFARFKCISGPSGSGSIFVGIRGTITWVSGIPQAHGYAVQATVGSSTISLVRRTSGSAVWTVVATGTLAAPITYDAYWTARIQIRGSIIKARVFTGTEHTTWDVSYTDGSPIGAGAAWLGFTQTTAEAREWRVSQIYESPITVDSGDPPPTNNHTETGSVTVTDTSDTAISVDVTWTQDLNNNNTVTLKYRPANATAWIPMNGTSSYNRTTKTFTGTITGLQAKTTYNLEVTFQDADGVTGANPIVVSHTTQEKGILAKALSITGVTDSTISLESVYERDTDNDSTATVEARKTSTESFLVEDFFVDEREGTYLQNVESVRGGDWQKHPSMTPEVHAILSGRYFYVNTTTASQKSLYTHTNTTAETTYEVEAHVLGSDVYGQTGIAVRLHATDETYYGFGINGTTRKWEYFKMLAGVKTVLHTTDFSGDLNLVYKLRVVVQPSHRRVYLNDVLIFMDFDSSLAETGRFGFYSTGINAGTPANQFKLGTFRAFFRTAVGSFVSYGAASVDRPTKTFSKTITGLDQDSVYEIRVLYTDPDGAEIAMLATTAMTTGSAVKLVAMGATTSATSAIIDVFYDFDVNNNSYVTVQYRDTRDFLWTTIASDKTVADRVTNKFSTTLAGLRASTTYEVRVDITDPEGLIEGSPSRLVGLFTTKGFYTENQTKRKHYLWKIYDPKGNYLATLPDAPEPDFAMHENGGVTDLSFTLFRRMSEYETQKIIAFQNIVDIWALDPSSHGMGPNLIADPDCDPAIGAWIVNGTTFGQNSDYRADGGPDGSSCIEITGTTTQYETSSNPIEAVGGLPLVISCIARAKGAKLRMYARSYNVNDVAIDSSSEISETVGTDWQKLEIEYIPPANTAYVRVLIRNTGRGQMWADKFSVLSKEILVYRGRIESYTPSIDESGEQIEIQALGLASLLSDDYIEFLQFVEVQSLDDVEAGRPNNGAKDPADMFKFIIDEARRVNPFFTLYYTSESIRYTGNLMQYTFRDQQVRAAMDKARSLCPSGWHYFIEPDGLVVLRGPEHAPTHLLRIGVEVSKFSVEKSIRNLKNYIRVKGRQDEDESEPDGYGSINYIAFDQKSIDTYGKRALFIRDAQLVDPDSAKIVGDGRLDEHNREEQRGECTIPDEKGEMVSQGALKGYNIESLRAGDNVIIVDALAGPRNTYWDQFNWDEGMWDIANVYMPLPESVPIKTVRFRNGFAELELSERPPSSVGDFSKFYRWAANKDRED